MIINNVLFKKEFVKYGYSSSFIKKKNSFCVNKIVALFPFLKKFLVDKSFFYSEDDVVVYFDACIKDSFYLKYIAKKCPQKRLIFYYWNPVSSSITPGCIPSVFEKWSYSLTDCQKYGLKFNPTFYFDDFVEESSLGITQDVFFIGKDKGRYAELMNFEKLFAKKGLSTKFVVTANHSISLCRKYSKSISYKEVLENVKRSKCLFDYYTDPQAGLSLRAMESLFFEKKLITNNQTIDSYDFYNPANVFVIGKRSFDDLDFFMKQPYCPVDSKIKEKYMFKNWIKRF